MSPISIEKGIVYLKSIALVLFQSSVNNSGKIALPHPSNRFVEKMT